MGDSQSQRECAQSAEGGGHCMSDFLKQTQEAGELSTAMQAGRDINITGITMTEARQIALDVFKANALELAGIARELFEARAQKFIEQIGRASCRGRGEV